MFKTLLCIKYISVSGTNSSFKLAIAVQMSYDRHEQLYRYPHKSHVYLENQSPTSVPSGYSVPKPPTSSFIIIILVLLPPPLLFLFFPSLCPTISIIAPNCKSRGIISIRRSGYTCCKNVALGRDSLSLSVALN